LEANLELDSLRIAVVVGSYPPIELARRTDLIRSYSTPGVDVDVVQIAPSPYAAGFAGKQAESTIPYFVEGFLQAQAAGFHAVLPLGVLDIGIDEGKQAARIPVVGAYEALIHTAAFFGRRIGVITYNAALVDTLKALTEKYAVTPLVCGYGHVGFELPDFSSRQAELEDAFCVAAQTLITQHGANVIASAGISLCPVHLDRRALEARLGVPVVEAIAAPIAIAAMLARKGLLPVNEQGSRTGVE
jgi:allantoin racemase